MQITTHAYLGGTVHIPLESVYEVRRRRTKPFHIYVILAVLILPSFADQSHRLVP